jgi:hypothetical protein
VSKPITFRGMTLAPLPPLRGCHTRSNLGAADQCPSVTVGQDIHGTWFAMAYFSDFSLRVTGRASRLSALASLSQKLRRVAREAGAL